MPPKQSYSSFVKQNYDKSKSFKENAKLLPALWAKHKAKKSTK